MLHSSRSRILADLADDALVLDVGGWAVPFPRADWMLDIAPYETRGTWGYDGDPADERFTAATWVQRDICDREPWPFADGQFDFAICSHTLEDVRDPVWVCAELQRVSKAGYVEVPSRLVEQAYAVHGEWTGWSHHHWLIDVDQAAASIDFVFKSHAVHAPQNRLPAGYAQSLSEERKVQTLWWDGSFAARERVILEPAELDAYLQDFVAANAPPKRSRLRRLRS